MVGRIKNIKNTLYWILKPKSLLVLLILFMMVIIYQIVDSRYMTLAKIYVEYRLEKYFGDNNIHYSNLSFYSKDNDIHIYISDFRIHKDNNNMILIKELRIKLDREHMFSIPKISSVYADDILISDNFINILFTINNTNHLQNDGNNIDEDKLAYNNYSNKKVTKGDMRKFFRFLDGIDYTFVFRNIKSSYMDLEHISVHSYFNKFSSHKKDSIVFDVKEKDGLKFFLMYFKNHHDAIYIDMDAVTSSKSLFWTSLFQSYIPEIQFVEHDLKFRLNGKVEFKNYNNISLSLDIYNIEGDFSNKFCTLTNDNITDNSNIESMSIINNNINNHRYCSIKDGKLKLLVKQDGLYIHNLNILFDGINVSADAEFSKSKKRINFKGNHFSEKNFQAIFNTEKNDIIGDSVYQFLEKNIHGFISENFSGYYDVKTGNYLINSDFHLKKLNSFLKFMPEVNNINGSISIANKNILIKLGMEEYTSISKFEIDINNDENQNYFLNINALFDTKIESVYEDFNKFLHSNSDNFSKKIAVYTKNINNMSGNLKGKLNLMYNFQNQLTEYNIDISSNELISTNDKNIKLSNLLFDLKGEKDKLVGNTIFFINNRQSKATIFKDSKIGNLNILVDSYITSDILGIITASNDKLSFLNHVIKKPIKVKFNASSKNNEKIEFQGKASGKISSLNFPFSNLLYANAPFLLNFKGERNILNSNNDDDDKNQNNNSNRNSFFLESLNLKSDHVSIQMNAKNIGNNFELNIDEMDIYDNSLQLKFNKNREKKKIQLSSQKLTYEEWVKFFQDISVKDNNKEKNFFSFKNYIIDFKIKELALKNNIAMHNILANIDIDKNIFKVNSYFGKGNHFTIDTPDKIEKNILISSDNIGYLIYGFTGQKYIVDGDVELEWRLSDGFKDYGNLILKNFYLKTVPVIAKILSVASIDIKGIKNMFAGKGVHMYQSKASFNYANGVLEIIDGDAHGAMLGFSFKGAYYIPQNEFIFYGSAIPVYNVNKFFSSIPLIGEVFSDKDHQGIFTVDYSVKKEAGEIKVKTNSLNAVTPAVLKKIFSR